MLTSKQTIIYWDMKGGVILAWVNTEITGIPYSTIDTSQFTNTGNWSVNNDSLPAGYSFQIAVSFRENGESIHGTTDFWIFGNTSYGILCHNTQGYQWNWKFQFYLNGEIIAESNTYNFGSNIKTCFVCFAFGLNENDLQGSIIYISNQSTGTSPANTFSCFGAVLNNSSYTACYNWIKQGAIPPYTWQSVASLNTKQGSYKFTYIDSEAIEDADNQTVSRNDVSYVSTKITDFLAGIPSGNVNNILETEDGYRIVAKRDSTNGDYYIGFKVGDTLEWFDTISTLLAPITSIGFVIAMKIKLVNILKRMNLA